MIGVIGIVVACIWLAWLSCWLEERAGLGWVIPAGAVLFLVGLAV